MIRPTREVRRSASTLRGLIRPRDVADRITRRELAHLVEKGELQKLARGLYAPADLKPTEHHGLAEAGRLVPRGVVCLLSALRFHGLTTQNPFEVWLAIDQKAWRPRGGGLPLRIFYMSGIAATMGIETHRVEGVEVRVFSAAKTVADCFKFRNRIGLDVALEALREYRRLHRGGMDELWRCADACRVSRVMTPYVEALS